MLNQEKERFISNIPRKYFFQMAWVSVKNLVYNKLARQKINSFINAVSILTFLIYYYHYDNYQYYYYYYRFLLSLLLLVLLLLSMLLIFFILFYIIIVIIFLSAYVTCMYPPSFSSSSSSFFTCFSKPHFWQWPTFNIRITRTTYKYHFLSLLFVSSSSLSFSLHFYQLY